MSHAAMLQLFNDHTGPFEWGQRDCVSLARAWVERVRGEPLKLPTWRDEREARQVLAHYGGLRGALCAVLGQPLPADQAHPGDVVLVLPYRGKGEEGLAPAHGEFTAGVWCDVGPVCQAAHGVVRLPARWVTDCWRPI